MDKSDKSFHWHHNVIGGQSGSENGETKRVKIQTGAGMRPLASCRWFHARAPFQGHPPETKGNLLALADEVEQSLRSVNQPANHSSASPAGRRRHRLTRATNEQKVKQETVCGGGGRGEEASLAPPRGRNQLVGCAVCPPTLKPRPAEHLPWSADRKWRAEARFQLLMTQNLQS